jgi:hypothetical protein
LYRDRREAIENAYRAPTHKLAISETLAARLTSLGFGPAESVADAAGEGPLGGASARHARR